MKLYVGSLGLNEQAKTFEKCIRKSLSLLIEGITDFNSTVKTLQNSKMNLTICKAIILCPQHFLITAEKNTPQKGQNDNARIYIPLPTGGLIKSSSLLDLKSNHSFAFSWRKIGRYMQHIFEHIVDDKTVALT